MLVSFFWLIMAAVFFWLGAWIIERARRLGSRAEITQRARTALPASATEQEVAELAESIRRAQFRIGPVQLLVIWLVLARAAGMMAQGCYAAVIERMQRWPEYRDRARRETV